MDDPVGPDEAEIERLRAEQLRLEAEVGELRSRLGTDRRRRGGRTRRMTATALVVAASLVFTVAVAGVWARRNALNTSRWVETVGPIAEDPAVQQALGRWATDELMGVIDPESFFESVLPERGQILAVPLTNALRGFVNDKVDEFLATDTFANLWVEANERAHRRIVQVLEGGGDPPPGVEVRGDDVIINVVPVLNAVLARIGDASPEIFGRQVDLPTVSMDDLPEAAIERIEEATGRDLPDDFGQFTVFDARQLRQVQDAVDIFNRTVVLAVVLAVVLIALALWVSPRRRRTLIQLCVGIALGIVLIRRMGLRLEDDVIDKVRPENQDAARVVVGAFVSSLLDATAWILGAAALVAVVAVVSGPYPWARTARARAVSGARDLAALVRAGVTGEVDTPAAQWVGAHREIVQGGAIVAGILVLLLADLSWFGLLVLLALVAAVVVGVQRIADVTATGEVVAPAEGGPPGPTPGPAVQPR
jgi:hypothetical protein